jgi:hypothetical protein
VTTIAAPDCPQDVDTIGPYTDLRWRLNGDPAANAKVKLDGDLDRFVVSGDFSMTANWTSDDLLQFDHSGTATGSYKADVLWDGSNPVLAGIDYAVS